MTIEKLQIKDFRNIEKAELAPIAGVNIICGENASGKSSLLEAIHLLLTSKSFRSSKTEVVIRKEQNKLQVISKLKKDNLGKVLGIEKYKNITTIRYAGESVSSAAKLASIQPVVLLTPESHQLIVGGPAYRRKFLDWLLFHVEQSYYENWCAYNKVLKQRNAILRKRKVTADLFVWDEKLIQAGNSLNKHRKVIVSRFINKLKEKTSNYCEFPIELRYECGWGDLELSEVIEKGRDKDVVVGYTRKGPHRADLIITTQEQPASQVLSRGQTKLLAAALEVSKITLLKEITGKSAIILVDDLAAELDAERKEKITEMLSSLDMQQFITATESKLLPKQILNNSKMFHVEHGKFQEVVY